MFKNINTIVSFVVMTVLSILISHILDPFFQLYLDYSFLPIFLNIFLVSSPMLFSLFCSPSESWKMGLIYGIILNILYSYLYNINILEFFTVVRLVDGFLKIFLPSFILFYVFKEEYKFYKIFISLIIGLGINLNLLLSLLDNIPLEYLNITDEVYSFVLVAILYSFITKKIAIQRGAILWFYKILEAERKEY